jgi:hypothetical protein
MSLDVSKADVQPCSIEHQAANMSTVLRTLRNLRRIGFKVRHGYGFGLFFTAD